MRKKYADGRLYYALYDERAIAGDVLLQAQTLKHNIRD